MTAPTVDPRERYQNRAVNRPKPDDHIELEFEHGVFEGQLLTTHTFHADASEYQPPLTTAYPSTVFCHRLHTGYRIDNHAALNWSVAEGMLESGKLQLNIGYVVYVPGRISAIMADLKNRFGSTPHPRLVTRTDMESGAGFAGPGNHSAEANALSGELAEWHGGSWAKTDAYANLFDFGDLWPQIDGRLKKAKAGYGVNDLSPFAWQYYGGDSRWPSPPGYPRSIAPFGSYVDMNVINLGIGDILSAYGVNVPPLPIPAHSGHSISSVAAVGDGWAIVSPSSNYFAQLQGDGNLVVYNRVTRHADWSSRTQGKGVIRMQVQVDGNVALYKAGPHSTLIPVWSTQTDAAGSHPVHLDMQDDGNLVLYSATTGRPAWSSKGGRI